MYKDHGADFQNILALIVFSQLFQKIPVSENCVITPILSPFE